MTSTATISPARPGAEVKMGYRWMQLILGVICMVAAANIQYAWTLFVPEIQKTFGWQRAWIQTAFTIFVLVQTWLTPFEGYLIDRLGPRIIVLVGGLFTGLAWIMDSYADSLTGYYVAAAVGGIGVGCVFATCVNNAIKWFPDRRGLAVGFTAGAYGAGSALTILPIANMITAGGFQAAFFWYGLIQGIIIMLASLAMWAPIAGETRPSTLVRQSRRDYTLLEAAKTPVFYLLFLMFTMTVTGGLMAVAQLGPMSQDLDGTASRSRKEQLQKEIAAAQGSISSPVPLTLFEQARGMVNQKKHRRKP
jgi:oxalate/formate antiporter